MPIHSQKLWIIAALLIATALSAIPMGSDNSISILLGLGLALVLGLLVGIERGWQERAAAEGSRLAGIRTFGLIGLLGGLLQLLAGDAGQWLLGVGFLSFALVMVVAHFVEARASRNYSVTTLIASLITFVFGALAMRGEHIVAASGAVVTTVLLSLKPILHRWLQRIEPQELMAALKLLLISIVILPILPDRNYGPWGALNPYQIWWVVVLLAAISFSGYCAVKIIGTEKGILLTGFLGGLISSTAVSIHLARLGKHSKQTQIIVAGALVAWATMFGRVLLVAAIINPSLFWPLSLPLASMAAVLFVFALSSWFRHDAPGSIESFNMRNPVELEQAIQFGAFLAFVLLLTKAIHSWLGDVGLYVIAGIAGVADVDALTVSLSRMAGSDLGVNVAVLAIVLATLVNTVTKTIMVGVFGGFKMARQFAWPVLITLSIGALAFWSVLS